jgi:lipopolysaccharide/colanic/teichoic acid biosynthesis glycosyltransferase
MNRHLPRPSECFDAAQTGVSTGLFNRDGGPLPRKTGRALGKHALDFGFGGLGVLLLAPLLPLIAVAIKLDSPGPVFFRQPRRGLNNKTFILFKFRSMYTHLSDIDAIRQTSRDDPRVTPVGKWLRRLSFDELPQLLNVMRGEMSLVGPRPHAPNMRVEGKLLETASSDYLLRYSVKPGITGWAQVHGIRGEIVKPEDLRRRIAYDLEYIRSWSIRLDLKILFLTAKREIFSKNAF